MKAAVFAALAGLCWGVGEVFTRSVLHSGKVGPLTAIAVRSTVALPFIWVAGLMALYVARAEPREWWRADAPTLLKLILGSGVLAGALGMIFFYTALGLGEVSRVKPIAFTIAPAIAVLLGWAFLHEPMTLRKAAAITLILAGVALLTTGAAPSQSGSGTGVPPVHSPPN